MIYPQNFEQKIGFDQIRQLLKDKCLSTLGEERVNEMNFSDHFEEVDELLNQVAEFVRIIQEEDNFPDQFFFDVRPCLIYAVRWRPSGTSSVSCSAMMKKNRIVPTPA